ncbi:hypothetical protein [Brevibacillus laterosporus]|uniref:hypothetical protein n=1 Tax=Brevibacillus laterosporus TaxID=1465 RepID=UPI003D20553D
MVTISQGVAVVVSIGLFIYALWYYATGEKEVLNKDTKRFYKILIKRVRGGFGLNSDYYDIIERQIVNKKMTKKQLEKLRLYIVSLDKTSTFFLQLYMGIGAVIATLLATAIAFGGSAFLAIIDEFKKMQINVFFEMIEQWNDMFFVMIYLIILLLGSASAIILVKMKNRYQFDNVILKIIEDELEKFKS